MIEKTYKKVDEKKVKIKDNVSGYDKKLLVKKFILPNGMPEQFFIDDNKSSVQVFAITNDNHVICVKQFRPGTEKIELELPGGGLEDGENLKEAAIRELVEETGFITTNVEHLTSLPYSPYSTGLRHSFLALNCRQEYKLNLDPNEFLQVTLIPLEKFKIRMREGSVRGFDIAYIALDRLGLL